MAIKIYPVTFLKMTFHFVPFAVVGDPSYDESLEVVKAYVDSGVTMLELGFPFSDPVADGPVIQAADVRALNAGMNTDRAFEFIEEVRGFTDLPIHLLLYFNLVFAYGMERFFERANIAGVTSVLIADLPVDSPHGKEVLELAGRYGIRMVFMVSELTSRDRLKSILNADPYFLYLVSQPGVTGMRQNLGDSVGKVVSRLKKETTIPVLVGFGISERAHVEMVRDSGADGVIVGSALVEAREEGELLTVIHEFA